MKILRNKAGLGVDGGVFIGTWDGPAVMGHDVVEINPEAKAVGRFDQILEFRGSAVFGGNGSTLILVTQIKPVKGAETYVPDAGTLKRGWKPKCCVTCFSQFRHL